VANTGADVADIALSGAYGTREVASLQPGRSLSTSFAARSASVPAGAISFAASPVVASGSAAYDAISCG